MGYIYLWLLLAGSCFVNAQSVYSPRFEKAAELSIEAKRIILKVLLLGYESLDSVEKKFVFMRRRFDSFKTISLVDDDPGNLFEFFDLKYSDGPDQSPLESHPLRRLRDRSDIFRAILFNLISPDIHVEYPFIYSWSEAQTNWILELLENINKNDQINLQVLSKAIEDDFLTLLLKNSYIEPKATALYLYFLNGSMIQEKIWYNQNLFYQRVAQLMKNIETCFKEETVFQVLFINILLLARNGFSQELLFDKLQIVLQAKTLLIPLNRLVNSRVFMQANIEVDPMAGDFAAIATVIKNEFEVLKKNLLNENHLEREYKIPQILSSLKLLEIAMSESHYSRNLRRYDQCENLLKTKI